MYVLTLPKKRWCEVLLEGSRVARKRRIEENNETTMGPTMNLPDEGVHHIYEAHKGRSNKLVTYKSYSSRKDYQKLLDHCVNLRIESFQRFILPLLQKLINHPRNHYFNQPVDPVALGIPDYFERIEEPMDLGTVKQDLLAGNFQSLNGVINSIFLVFNNAMTYNHK